MGLDYQQIGQRIAVRRRALGLRQTQVCERCDINSNYLSNIERARSIPSLEVFMRICAALDATPDEFLVGTARSEENETWRDVSELLRGLDGKRLELAKNFLCWLREQELEGRGRQAPPQARYLQFIHKEDTNWPYLQGMIQTDSEMNRMRPSSQTNSSLIPLQHLCKNTTHTRKAPAGRPGLFGAVRGSSRKKYRPLSGRALRYPGLSAPAEAARAHPGTWGFPPTAVMRRWSVFWTPMGSAWSSDRYSLWSFQDAKAKGELLRQRQIPIWMMEPLRGGRLAALSQEEDGAPLRGLRSGTGAAGTFFKGGGVAIRGVLGYHSPVAKAGIRSIRRR